MVKGGNQVKLQIVQRLNNSSKVEFVTCKPVGAQIILGMIMMFFFSPSEAASSEES